MFSDDELQQIIAGNVIGDRFPYDTKEEQEIEAHIRRLLYRIRRIPNIICEAEWDHFGSGYASFVEFFCYRKEDRRIVEEKYGRREEKTEGIIIDICRLAPVVIMGEDERYQTVRIETNEVVCGAYSTLLGDPRRLHVPDRLQPLREKIRQALEEYSFDLLEAEIIGQPLPFQANIPTIYQKPKDYLIMDAIYYWED